MRSTAAHPITRFGTALAIYLAVFSFAVPLVNPQNPAIPRDPREWVLGLADGSVHVPAGNVNHCPFPVDEVVPLLVDALQSQPEFETEQARHKAYLVLTNLGGQSAGGIRVIRNQQQIEQLIAGLSEDAPAIRRMCSEALGFVDASHAEAAVDALIRALVDADVDVVYQAVSSLERYSSVAKKALPSLKKLLDNPSPEQHKAWEKQTEKWHETFRSSQFEGHERRIRSAAASARLAIQGVAGELTLYSQLDEPGRDAAAFGLAMYILKSQGMSRATASDRHGAFLFLGNYLTAERILKLPHKDKTFHMTWLKGCVSALVQLGMQEGRSKVYREMLVTVVEKDVDAEMRTIAQFLLDSLP